MLILILNFNGGEMQDLQNIFITKNIVIYFIIIELIVFLMLNHVKILNNLVMQRTNELNNQLVENKNLYNRHNIFIKM